MTKATNLPLFLLMFVVPGLTLYLLIAIFPLFQAFFLSFHKWTGIYGADLQYVGLKNFEYLLGNRRFIQSLINIALYLGISLVTQIPIGFGLALLLYSYCRGYSLFKTVFFVPVIISATAVALIMRFILFPEGPINSILTSIGLESIALPWLTHKSTAMVSIILVTAWAGVGYYMTIFFAALSSIPKEILESALLDGANSFQKLRYVIIPIILDPIKVCVIFLLTGIMKSFEFVFLLTEGGPNGLTHIPATFMFQTAFAFNRFGRAAAVAVFIFLMSLALSYLSARLLKREEIQY